MIEQANCEQRINKDDVRDERGSGESQGTPYEGDGPYERREQHIESPKYAGANWSDVWSFDTLP